MNKKDERVIVVRNKSRLVAQRHKQEEGIDYDEVFVLVARIEAIRIFLAFTSFMGFIIYQIDVKSAFLYDTIEEEVYVCQPPRFIDPQFLNKVYKVDKALYVLHQAPRAWYETLSTFLLQNGYRRGTIDKILFIKKNKDDIMLVQVYVDDIIFESTKNSLCDEFEALMHKRFQMSSIRELTFFLGLQEIGLDDRPRRQETTLGGTDAQPRFETASKKSRDPPLSKVNTSGNREDIMEHLDDLMDFVPPTPHDSPLSRGHTPGSDEGRVETPTDKSLDEDASKQGRIDDKIEELNLTDGADTKVIIEDKGSYEKCGSTADQVSTARPEVCTARVPVNLRSEKEKVKGVAFRDVEEPPRLTRSTITLQPLPNIDPKDKGKGVLVEEEPEKLEKVKRRDQGLAQIKRRDQGLAQIKNADHELIVRMTHEEQQKYTIEERARLLAEYFKRRNKKLAVERAKAIRNKPPTRTQVKNKMITYLKHMGKYTHQQLKHKTLEELQRLYQKEQKWINDFVPMDSKKEEKKSVEPESKGKKGKIINKVTDSALEQKSSKKQKMMQEQESSKSDEEE
nr:putative ribonuclease H-like domain-containing protein [Tanacetum cinerariifolium]